MADEELDRLLASADSDGDGGVDFLEFQVTVTPSQSCEHDVTPSELRT